jgi:hypothetical protein
MHRALAGKAEANCDDDDDDDNDGAALAHNVTRIPAVAVLSLERLLCNGGSAEALQCVTYCTQNQPASCVGN